MIMPLVKPIDLMTEISLTCSYKLPVIDEDSEKKQMNIVIAMITLKIISSVCSACTEKDKSVYRQKRQRGLDVRQKLKRFSSSLCTLSKERHWSWISILSSLKVYQFDWSFTYLDRVVQNILEGKDRVLVLEAL